MNINSPFPEDVDVLIEQLDKIFPNQVPNPADTEREVWIKVGKVQAVAFLKAWRKASLEKQPLNSATIAGRSTNHAERTKGSARRHAGRRSTRPEKGGR